MDFFDVVTTQRAMRRLKPDVIADDVLKKIMDAAICAPMRQQRSSGLGRCGLALPSALMSSRDFRPKRRWSFATHCRLSPTTNCRCCMCFPTANALERQRR